MDTKIKATIERGNDGMYSAYTDYNLLGYGLLGFGESAEDAMKDFMESYKEARDMISEKGGEAPELEFEFYWDVASFLDFYSEILSKPGLEKITGINQKQLWHYSSGVITPRSETARKIQNSLHNFADVLKQVHFID